MAQETGLKVVDGDFIELRREPTEVLDDAKRAAKALTTVIDQKPRKVMIKGQVYLEYEDWQTVAQFYGYTVRTHSAVPVEFNGVKGAKAEADLIDFRSGMVVGGAEAYCMADEENWGSKPWFQLASMAQTRAGAKAIRNRMAWVVVLAGYSGTPAEEIIQEKISQRQEKSEHWCDIHNTNFFKKGKMKNYAHKIEGTDEWCNEPVSDKATARKDAIEIADPDIILPDTRTPFPVSVPDKTTVRIEETGQRFQLSEGKWHELEVVVPVIIDEPPLKNVGELLTRCKDRGIPRSEVFEILSIGSPTEIADLEEAWQIVKKTKAVTKKGESNE